MSHGLVQGSQEAGHQVGRAGRGRDQPAAPRYAPKAPPCGGTCPGGTDIRGWLTTIAQAEAYGRTPEQAYEMAWGIITDRNPFPAVCGRVCPHPCEDGCNRTAKEGAVAINALERFVGDFGIAQGLKLRRLSDAKRDEPVAVIGAGPAGSVLRLPARASRVPGHRVRGVRASRRDAPVRHPPLPAARATCSTPRFSAMLDLGVELRCNTVVGKDITLDELHADYKAIFVGIGAHKGLTLRRARRGCLRRVHRHRVPEPRQQRRDGDGRRPGHRDRRRRHGHRRRPGQPAARGAR